VEHIKAVEVTVLAEQARRSVLVNKAARRERMMMDSGNYSERK
jgi:hypothetical protein